MKQEHARFGFLDQDQFSQTDIHSPGSDPYENLDYWSPGTMYSEIGSLMGTIQPVDGSPMTSYAEVNRDQQSGFYASVRVAKKTLTEILDNTNAELVKRSKSVKLTAKRLDPAKGFWTFQAAGSKGARYTVRIKGLMDSRVKSLEKSFVQVSCTCDFFQWQGPEHWAKTQDFLLGKPRGTAAAPDSKDPKGRNWVCKHIVAALLLAKNYKFANLSVEPSPVRVAAAHMGG